MIRFRAVKTLYRSVLHYNRLGRALWPTVTLCLGCLLISSALLTHGQDWGDDWAGYVLQGLSLAKGTTSVFLEHNAFAMNNSSRVIGPTAYPWGVPLMIAGLYRVFGYDLLIFKFINIIAYALFLFCLFLLFRRKLKAFEILAVLGLFVFNPALQYAQESIGSDIPYLACSTVTLLLVDRCVVRRQILFNPWADGIGLGAAIFVATQVRSQGLLLFLTLLVSLVIQGWRYRRKGLILKAILTTGAVAVGLYALLAGLVMVVLPATNTETIQYFRQVSWAQIISNSKYYLELPNLFFEGLPFRKRLYFVTSVFFVIGLMLDRKLTFHYVFYSAVLLGSYVLFPFVQGLRYIFPILPIYFFLVWRGVKWSIYFLPRWAKGGAGALAVVGYALVIITLALPVFNGIRRNLANDRAYTSGPFSAASAELFKVVADTVKPDQVVVFFKPRALRLFADRQSIFVQSCDLLNRGNYIIIYREAIDVQVTPELAAACGIRYEQLFENNEFQFYRLLFP